MGHYVHPDSELGQARRLRRGSAQDARLQLTMTAVAPGVRRINEGIILGTTHSSGDFGFVVFLFRRARAQLACARATSRLQAQSPESYLKEIPRRTR